GAERARPAAQPLPPGRLQPGGRVPARLAGADDAGRGRPARARPEHVVHDRAQPQPSRRGLRHQDGRHGAVHTGRIGQPVPARPLPPRGGLTMKDSIARAVAAAAPRPLWLDLADAAGRTPAGAPPLAGDTTCDLAVVGGGFTGLWTALLAKERDPGRDVVLLEANAVAWAASGRNGGFVSSSLTHGLANGVDRWPDELGTLERLGLANLDELEQ